MLNFLKLITRNLYPRVPNLNKTLHVEAKVSNVIKEPIWDTWVSASETRNYLMNDPLLDWLEYYTSPDTKLEDLIPAKITKRRGKNCSKESKKDAKATKKDDPKGTMLPYLLQQGIDFEERVMKHLYSILPTGSIVDIKGTDNSRSLEKFNATKQAMIDGVPFIYSGVLWDFDTQTYGVPDLMARSDWISRIIPTFPFEDDDDIYESSGLTKGYHYRIIDIKFSSIKYRSEGWRMLNSGSMPAYKGQLYIYHRALSKLQSYDPEYAYVLGKGWCRTKSKSKTKSENCLSSLGVIDYSGWDEEYIVKTNKAVEWIRSVRKDGHTWHFNDTPLVRPELYPNMSNLNDQPWRPLKLQISERIKEISGLWMCGVKNRLIAHSKEVYRWDDKGCTMDILNIKNQKMRCILTKMIEVNLSENVNIMPRKIKNNPLGWKQKKGLELYVDFEVCTVTDTSQFPLVKVSTILSLIGVGHYDRSGRWVYQSFSVDQLTTRHTEFMVKAFNTYVEKLKIQYRTKNPLLVHYSNAEPNWWRMVSSKKYEWFDLLKLLKDEPVVIKGSLTYSLKDVARSMYNLGLINTIWDADVANGVDAMFQLNQTYESGTNNQAVVNYNEVDCKVLGEILHHLRKHHV